MKNNRTFFISLITFSVISLCLISCDKDEDLHGVNNATVTISSPLEDAIYHNGDTVWITGSIVADSVLHGAVVYVRNHENKSSLAVFNHHVHNSTLNVSEFWVPTGFADTTEVEVEISATIDHDGNSVGKKVEIKCVP